MTGAHNRPMRTMPELNAIKKTMVKAEVALKEALGQIQGELSKSN